jgi:hypothetical protein
VVLGTVLAAVQPDNTPHGYNWTFAYPMLLFIIVAGVLYLRFRRPHRVPGHTALSASRWATGRAAPAAAAPASPAAPAAAQPGDAAAAAGPDSAEQPA